MNEIAEYAVDGRNVFLKGRKECNAKEIVGDVCKCATGLFWKINCVMSVTDIRSYITPLLPVWGACGRRYIGPTTGVATKGGQVVLLSTMDREATKVTTLDGV